MGCHKNPIKTKGVMGSSTKIREELEELEDALGQGVKIPTALRKVMLKL
jgi:hypothetical protein